jgi:hypothetical protein
MIYVDEFQLWLPRQPRLTRNKREQALTLGAVFLPQRQQHIQRQIRARAQKGGR